MAKQVKPILDTTTGAEYPTMYAAGKALGTTLVPDYKGEPRLIWFAMVRAFPTRFQTRNTAGQWVALNDPSVPKITRARKTETDDQKKQRLLAELGEIAIRQGSVTSAQVAAVGSPGVRAAKKAVAGAALTETVEEEEVEGEGEAEAASAAPAKPKLATAMKKA